MPSAFFSALRPQLKLSARPPAYITISVDDGHPTDLRTADLLAGMGLRATFYIPARNAERAVMTEAQVRDLAGQFEVGAHTMNHRRVHRLSTPEAYSEISDGKKWLEDVTSREVSAFCYPGGKSNATCREIVAGLGFLGARTCELNYHQAPIDPFRWGVSTQAYSHGLMHSLKHNSLTTALNHLLVSKNAFDWERHFIDSLDWVEARGGIAHLYMHSWETDRLGEWAKLERVLNHAASRKTMTPATNGMLFAQWHDPSFASASRGRRGPR